MTIWVVRVGDELYVRSVNGRTSAWFRGAQVRHAGHIRAGGMDKDVTLSTIFKLRARRGGALFGEIG